MLSPQSRPDARQRRFAARASAAPKGGSSGDDADASSEPGCWRDQKQPCPDDDGSDGSRDALTALYWEDRLLGTNETIRVPVRCVWVMVGNNPIMSTEIARRSIRIRLDPKIDRPWLRTGFQHPNLRVWINRHRGQLIWAALVLAQHWLAQDRPPAPLKQPLGSYETWSTVIGGILHAAGCEGFLTNLETFYEIADHEGALWRAFVAAWWKQFGQQVVGTAIDGLNLGYGTERSQCTALGTQLRKQRDRVIGGYRIALAGESHRAKQWQLLPTQPEGRVTDNPGEPLYTLAPCTRAPVHFYTSRAYEFGGGARRFTRFTRFTGYFQTGPRPP